MAGCLTTHVLDTAQGRPAFNMMIELWCIGIDADDNERMLLKTQRTNANGRTDVPLLTAAEMQVGVYEFVFAVGEYFALQDVRTTTPPFLDRVPIRFSIADSSMHYHVPLLVSPWAYSTYRGS